MICLFYFMGIPNIDAQLESRYRSATIVGNICVYADPNKAKPIAIIVPTEKPLHDIAKGLGVQGDHMEEFVHDDQVNTAVLKQVQDAGRKAGLAGIEIISGIVLAEEEWTPQNVSAYMADYVYTPWTLDKD